MLRPLSRTLLLPLFAPPQPRSLKPHPFSVASTMKKSSIITTSPATWVLFPNVGSLPKSDIDVGTGLVGAPACGDVMKLEIRVDESSKISDVKFKTFGCGSAIASSSFMTERVKGLTLEQAGKIRNTEVAKELSLPPVKYVIQFAIRDYQSKRTRMATLSPDASTLGPETPVAQGAT